MAEASDHQALSSIRGQLDKVVAWATEVSRLDLIDIASTATALLGDLLQEQVGDPDAALELVSQAVASLQQAMEHTSGVSESDELSTRNVDLGTEDSAILEEFLSNQEDTLEEIEALALALSTDTNGSQLANLKGKIHTLKGEAGLLEMMDVSALCHSLEDAIQKRPLVEVTALLLSAVDWLRRRFKACTDGSPWPGPFEPPSDTTNPLAAESTALTYPSSVEEALPEMPAPKAAMQSPEPRLAEEENDSIDLEPFALSGDPELTGDFIIEAREHLEDVDDQLLALEKNSNDDEAINSVFRAFHTIKGLASFLELACVQHVAHEAETMLDMARCGKLSIAGPQLSLTFEVNDLLKRLITSIEHSLASAELMRPDASLPALMQKLKTVISGGTLPCTLKVAQPSETQMQGSPSQQAAGLSTPSKGAQEGEPEAQKVQVRETVRVDANRLDELVDSIGELVIAEAMVSQCEELDLKDKTLLPRLLTRMDKITRELQEMAMSLRMVSVHSTFRRMARLARDVATKVGKKIDFVTMGDDTDLDKTVVDSIGDPLVHMVRNAVDHGIEDSAEERQLAGKPPTGRIELRAFHRGGSIHIEIEDDGRGMDPKKIFAQALKRGIVNNGDKLTDSEIFNLIFAPGFSTAETVTDVSGRGVGLDVVKRGVEALRGTVELRSTPGKGSVFSLRLPLTLAIIDGMVVRVGKERYILPTLSIVRMVGPEEENITRVFDKHSLLQVGDDLVPLFQLNQLFDTSHIAQDTSSVSAVIVEHGGRRCALLVDKLLGQQQIVIKPLGPALAETPGLAGGTVMPDGQVGLILDIASLVQLAQSSDASTNPRLSPIKAK